MKKKNVYPEWAEKFRAEGKTIRKVRNGYGLYECTSTYVPGQKYPKSVQKYLGMITEKDGFIPKKSVSDTASFSIEYGLSHFIISNFKRDLQRSVFNSDMAVVVLGTVFYIFGSIDPAFLSSSLMISSRPVYFLCRTTDAQYCSDGARSPCTSESRPAHRTGCGSACLPGRNPCSQRSQALQKK